MNSISTKTFLGLEELKQISFFHELYLGLQYVMYYILNDANTKGFGSKLTKHLLGVTSQH